MSERVGNIIGSVIVALVVISVAILIFLLFYKNTISAEPPQVDEVLEDLESSLLKNCDIGETMLVSHDAEHGISEFKIEFNNKYVMTAVYEVKLVNWEFKWCFTTGVITKMDHNLLET